MSASGGRGAGLGILWLALAASVAAWAGEQAPMASAPGSQPPGVVIDHSPAASRTYIGSPSIAILPNGDDAASHDWFGPATKEDTTVVFGSKDRGRTWQKLAVVRGQYWSSLFVHRDALYLLGPNQHGGQVVIRRSADAGRTWTTPRDADSGLLLAEGNYHCAPVPVLVHNGRLWRAMEDTMGPGGWGSHFRAFVMSAPVDADLLKAGSWTCSNRLGGNPQWLGGKFGGWLEGNAVVSREGQLLNILRVDCPSWPEQAALIRLSRDGKTATFDPATGFVDFPGGAKKFTIRFDARSGLYWSLANYVPEAYRSGQAPRTRNTLALTASPDLATWRVHSILLQHPDTERHAFQYADWQFDGDDLAAVVRTAFDDAQGGAHNYHDANYLTFHRVVRFRERR